jgi:hypothetical protein
MAQMIAAIGNFTSTIIMTENPINPNARVTIQNNKHELVPSSF